ncbi:MAG: hypothetical protein GSR78_00840 [Desulfurococcales archaeon]|nr:hypothetical protein [Desulfurococcales archaeon]
MKITVPDEVKDSEVARWVAEGLSRRVLRDLIIEYLSEGIDVDVEKAVLEFEKTREEVWMRVGKEYREKGLV